MHAPGRVTLDAADLVAPVIGASHAQAQRRVEQAVRLAGGLVPVPADDRETAGSPAAWAGCTRPWPPGSSTATAPSVVAFELEVAPADVADAIVAALERPPG